MMNRLKWKWMIPFALVVILFPNKAGAEVVLPTGNVISKVDFEKHVVGLFGKVGCILVPVMVPFKAKMDFDCRCSVTKPRGMAFQWPANLMGEELIY